VLSVTAALQEQARQLREALHGEGEHVGDMLGSLMGKLSAGSAELRELGSSTEMSLTSLSNSVSHQVQGMSSTIQQISDRQKSLTTALDAQRDVLNGLLNRLTMAQDETASVAERTTARLNEGTQQIARQIEVIGVQAQTSLASVQTASAGFSDESGKLSQNAQQAEQEARAILSSAIALQEQARDALDRLQTEGDRVAICLRVLSKLSAGARSCANWVRRRKPR